MTLACSECRKRNYYTTRNRKREKKLELKKFCKFCNKHTLHKEVK